MLARTRKRDCPSSADAARGVEGVHFSASSSSLPRRRELPLARNDRAHRADAATSEAQLMSAVKRCKINTSPGGDVLLGRRRNTHVHVHVQIHMHMHRYVCACVLGERFVSRGRGVVTCLSGRVRVG